MDQTVTRKGWTFVGMGWRGFKANWVVLVGFLLLTMLVSAVLDSFAYRAGESYEVSPETAAMYRGGQMTDEDLAITYFAERVERIQSVEPNDELETVVTESTGSPLMSFVSFVVALVLGLLGVAVALVAARGQKITYESVMAYVSLKNVLYYFVASILVGIVVVVGMVMLIVPGIIFAMMFSMTYYLLVDKGMGPIESMKASKHMTSGNKWLVLRTTTAVIMLNILGLLALGVGLLLTIPTSWVTMGYLYRYLNGEQIGTGDQVPTGNNRTDDVSADPADVVEASPHHS